MPDQQPELTVKSRVCVYTVSPLNGPTSLDLIVRSVSWMITEVKCRIH
jgi:hypothetical protein